MEEIVYYGFDESRENLFEDFMPIVRDVVNDAVNSYAFNFEQNHKYYYDEDEIEELNPIKEEVSNRVYSLLCESARMMLFFALCNQAEEEDPANTWDGDDTYESLENVYGDTLFVVNDFIDDDELEEMANDETKRFDYNISEAIADYDSRREESEVSDYSFAY